MPRLTSRSVRLMRRLLVALLALLALPLLVAMPSASATQADDVMGAKQAGKYYMKSVCPSNNAADRYYQRIWKGRDSISWREVRRRLPEIKRESRRYGQALFKFSRKLFNPPAEWPEEVDALVTKLADASAVEGTLRVRSSKATNARAWGRMHKKASNVYYGQWAAKIRARLDLPPPGEGC